MTATPERDGEPLLASETRRTLDDLARWRKRLDQSLTALRKEIDTVQGIIDERNTP
jgi:hypothetical protein